MAETSPHLVFESSHFAIEKGEDDATNPGIFGRSLATWLGTALVPGFSAEDLVAEDFGWLVPVPSSRGSMYVACSSTDETAREWQVFVFAERGLVARLLRRGPDAAAVSDVYAALRKRIESEAGITNLREEP